MNLLLYVKDKYQESISNPMMEYKKTHFKHDFPNDPLPNLLNYFLSIVNLKSKGDMLHYL
jgi:hypothetical protein